MIEYLNKISQDTRDNIGKLVMTLWRQENWIESLQSENKLLKEEIYKDTELALMKSKYDEMKADYYRGFPISEKENIMIKKWIYEHEESHIGGHGVSGGKYEYIFTPTGIGTIGVLKCSCGKELVFQGL